MTKHTTPQGQPNPNELLSITREELERCCSQMSAAGYKVSANYVEAMVLSRSRPIASAPTEETCRKYWKYRSHSGHLYHLLFDLLGREFPEDEMVLADALTEVRENHAARDTAIRNATLDAVIAFCKSNDCVQKTYGNTECLATTDTECVICFIESLRKGEHP